MSKKILVLGGTGMLGHKVAQVLREAHEVYATVRRDSSRFTDTKMFGGIRCLQNVSVSNFASVEDAFDLVKPDVTVNCIGIVKQLAEADEHISSIEINSLFPHKLARVCARHHSRLISLSTDCVFSGNKGDYVEADRADPVDLYGQTKLLGEVNYPDALTLRTSIIGRQLAGHHGLLEWFLSQSGQTVKGYKNAIFSGFTTIQLARIIMQIIEQHQKLNGVWHVSSSPISKYDLLELVKEIYNLDVEIIPDFGYRCNRSLNSRRFQKATKIEPASWADMIQSMKDEQTKDAAIQVTEC